MPITVPSHLMNHKHCSLHVLRCLSVPTCLWHWCSLGRDATPKESGAFFTSPLMPLPSLSSCIIATTAMVQAVIPTPPVPSWGTLDLQLLWSLARTPCQLGHQR